jgi:hypothetical protein
MEAGMKTIKREIEFKLDQPLVEGHKYLIIYRDWHDKSERMADAMVVDGKFKYDRRFVMECVEPTFERTRGHHLILGIFKLSDWKRFAVESLNVAEIVSGYLVKNGFDGLVGDECGCALDDLIACDSEDVLNCSPGYKIPCTCGEGCEWHISINKPEDLKL